MEIIEQSYEILKLDEATGLFIEKCARTCYKSEEKITLSSANKLINMLIKSGHHSVLEHGFISVKFITDRAVTHELVRHRLVSYSQESQRYVSYKDGIKFIRPTWVSAAYLGTYKTRKAINGSCNSLSNMVGYYENEKTKLWLYHMLKSENAYKDMIEMGLKPEQARTILPNSTKTEIVVSANVREWRHIFKLRCTKKAYPQIRQLMTPLLLNVHKKIPILFDDLIWPEV